MPRTRGSRDGRAVASSLASSVTSRLLRVPGLALLGVEVGVAAAGLLGRRLGVVLQGGDELGDARVGGVAEEQLVAPRLQRDRGLQPGVGREGEAVLAL